MEAIREWVDVIGRTVTLTLPESFTSSRVEVIVLPVHDVATQASPVGARRRPSHLLDGTLVLGDLMAPVVPAGDWGALQ